jgi:hypothetical protein
MRLLAITLLMIGCGEAPPPTPPRDMTVVLPVNDLAVEPVSDLAMAAMPDLAVVNRQLSFTGSTLLPIEYAVDLVVGDFNEDKKVDIAVNADNFGSNHSLNLFLGDGNGGFAAPNVVQLPVAVDTDWLAAGDVDGDGHLDLISTDPMHGTFNVLPGNGKGDFGALRTFPGSAQPGNVAVGDVNHDGIDDLALIDNNDQVKVYLGTLQGTFTLKSTNQFSIPQFLALGDVTGDTKLDLLVGENGGMTVAIGTGDGTFGLPKSVNGLNSGWVATGDLDGDSKIDLAIVEGSGTIASQLSDGKGGFGAPSQFVVNMNAMLLCYADALADFDGDGTLDLAVVGDFQQLFVFPGDGKGGWKPQFTTATAKTFETSLVAADFNGDGKPDVAIASAGRGTAEVLLNTSQ